MLQLSNKWGPVLVSQPETGMGYQIASITLHDGRCYNQAVIESGRITRIRNYDKIPFKEEDIAEIIVTHDKWDFSRDG